MKETYMCALCKETFEKGQSNEEALEEAKELFPTEAIENMPLLCEECFIEVMDANEPGQKRYADWIEVK